MHNKVKINNFEKKPQNGGTPAMENKAIIKTLVKKLLDPKSLKECNVL